MPYNRQMAPLWILAVSTLTLAVTAIAAYRQLVRFSLPILKALNAIQGTIADFDFPATDPTPLTEDPRIAALQTHINDLTIAIDTGVNRVQRSENRVRAIIQGARKELAEHGFEHAGVEAETSELRKVDGEGSDGGRVPPVPENVEATDDAPSSIRGVTIAQLRRAKFGR